MGDTAHPASIPMNRTSGIAEIGTRRVLGVTLTPHEPALCLHSDFCPNIQLKGLGWHNALSLGYRACATYKQKRPAPRPAFRQVKTYGLPPVENRL